MTIEQHDLGSAVPDAQILAALEQLVAANETLLGTPSGGPHPPSPLMATTSAPLREAGYAGGLNPTGWWGLGPIEETPELQWPNSTRVYDAMRRQDSQVMSVMRAVWLPVQSTGWWLDPNGARDEVVELVADDLALPILGQTAPPPRLRTRDRFTWRQHLSMVRLMLPFGHMPFEQLYRIDDRGRGRLRKLAPRMPRTIAAVNVENDGGLNSIEQWAPPGSTRPDNVRISVNRLVVYVHEREGGNWLGTSLLRPAYKNWLLKDRLLRVGVETIDRNGMGVPMYYGAEGETNLTKGTQLAQSFRSGAAAGGSAPYGAKLVLQGVEGELIDALPWVKWMDEQIARAVLAHFLNLDVQSHGSYALGTEFADFFTASLNSVADEVCDTANQHIVEDLVDINWGESEPAPRIVYDPIGSKQTATSTAIKDLLSSGALRWDEGLEAALRQQYGWPPYEGADEPPRTEGTPS